MDLLTGTTFRRLVGQIAHFTYWKLFSSCNVIELDLYHVRQLFFGILQNFTQLQKEHAQVDKIYKLLYLPVLLVAVRVAVTHLFQQRYPSLLKKHLKEVVLGVNNIITHTLDPNQYLSRFTLLDARQEAVKMRESLVKKKKNGIHIRRAFYARSPLLRSILPQPSDGKVRALFGTLPPIAESKKKQVVNKSRVQFRSQSTQPPDISLGSIKNLRKSHDLASLTFSEMSPVKIQKPSHSFAKNSSLFGLSTPGKHFVSAQTLETTNAPFSSHLQEETEKYSYTQAHTLSHDISLSKSIEHSSFMPVLEQDTANLQRAKETAYFEKQEKKEQRLTIVHSSSEESEDDEKKNPLTLLEDPSLKLLNRVQLYQIASEKWKKK